MAGLHLRYPTSKLGKDMIDELLKRFCTAQKRIDSIKVSKVSKKKGTGPSPAGAKKRAGPCPVGREKCWQSVQAQA